MTVDGIGLIQKLKTTVMKISFLSVETTEAVQKKLSRLLPNLYK
jgi:hypothetical protein